MPLTMNTAAGMKKAQRQPTWAMISAVMPLAIETPTFPKTPFHDMVRARLTAVSISIGRPTG